MGMGTSQLPTQYTQGHDIQACGKRSSIHKECTKPCLLEQIGKEFYEFYFLDNKHLFIDILRKVTLVISLLQTRRQTSQPYVIHQMWPQRVLLYISKN